ncbi:MAG: PilN domain-containing protein [Patescibacteria group bacterium]
MPARVKEINLLQPSEFEESFGGKLLKWAVSTGRYIIILTELVVIVAFFSRFKLDRDVSLLTDEIQGQVNILEANEQLEQDFRSSQSRVVTVGKLLGDQMQTKVILDNLISDNGGRTTLSSLSIVPSLVTLTGQAGDETKLGGFLANLAKNPRWRSVEVTEISGDKDVGVKFTLSIKR